MLSQALSFSSSISLTPLGTKYTKHLKMNIHHIIYLFMFFSLSSFHVSQAAITTPTQQHFKANINPFTPKASLIRYWNTHVSNKHQIPHFLLSKASPLTPQHYAILNNLLTNNPFSSESHKFLCSTPNFFCSFDQTTPQLFSSATKDNANFAIYSNKHFGNYGSSRVSGTDSFKNYSNGLNTINDSFKKYSTSSTHHGNEFSNYAENGNVANANFTSYGSGATAVSGGFDNYDNSANVPNLRFTTYDSAATDHKLSFSSYGNETNAGIQSFMSYGKRVRGGTSEFTNYAVSTNILQSQFTSYGELGTKATNDSFKFYSSSGNNPQSNFQTYGAGSISGKDSFTSYRNTANVGADSFQSYAAKSNSGTATFSNYGKSFNLGNDSFKEYGKGSKGHSTFEFKSYDLGRDFKEYNKQGASFSEYHNFTPASGKIVNKSIEEGKFFRESMLKEGNIIVMPDIKDKMPQRSFLPLTISSKLPFSSSRLSDINEIFQVHEGSATERVILNALRECERKPSIGETKRCVGSAEGMIDFAISVLGPSVMVRTTENVNGSRKSVMIGRVYGVNNGKVTKSVSCHQSLYPHLLYYCHSVPKVRVYEVDILDTDTKVKINHGVAICHLDTSAWGPQHGAFLALGSSPGKIEVCHWIFQNDMTWTIGS